MFSLAQTKPAQRFSNFGITARISLNPREARYQSIISGMAEGYQVSENLIKAIIATESSWDEKARIYESKLGEASVGLMQVLPSTAKKVLNNPNLTEAQLFAPATNIQAGAAYLAQLQKKYARPDQLYAAYNAGSLYYTKSGAYVNQGNVDRFLRWYQGYTTGKMPINFTPYIAIGMGLFVVAGFFLLQPQKQAVSSGTV